MSKPVRVAIAAAASLAALVLVVWFDGVVRAVQNDVQATFDVRWLAVVDALDGLALGAAVIAVAAAIWWARSSIAALGFTLVGVVLAFGPAVFTNYDYGNGGPPVPLDPATWLMSLYPYSVDSVSAICGAMILASVAVLVLAGRRRIGSD